MINLSKTQSIKQQILSAVSSGHDLTLSQIRYLQDILPNEDKVQSTGLNFDHTKDNTWEACGLSYEQVMDAQTEIQNIINEYMQTEQATKSGVVEEILTKGSKILLNVLIIENICDKFKSKDSSDMSDMMKLMMLMAKMKGGDK